MKKIGTGDSNPDSLLKQQFRSLECDLQTGGLVRITEQAIADHERPRVHRSTHRHAESLISGTTEILHGREEAGMQHMNERLFSRHDRVVSRKFAHPRTSSQRMGQPDGIRGIAVGRGYRCEVEHCPIGCNNSPIVYQCEPARAQSIIMDHGMRSVLGTKNDHRLGRLDRQILPQRLPAHAPFQR